MKVILLEENRVANVSDGYARNYLFPRKLAMLATDVNLLKFEKMIKEKELELTAKKQEAMDLARKIEESEIVILADAGEEGKLFGSVTAQDVIDAISRKTPASLDKRSVNLNEQIKKIGEYVVSVKLYHEVTAHARIKVVKK